jgi:hypothetical protein
VVFTYSGDPQASDLDRVRFLIGDTDAGDPLLQDEEVVAEIATAPTVLWAAVRAARRLQARFARAVNKSVGGFSLSASNKSSQFAALAEQLEAEARAEDEAAVVTPTPDALYLPVAYTRDPMFTVEQDLPEEADRYGWNPRWSGTS